MSVATSPPKAHSDDPAEPPFRPITVAMYSDMIRHGIIGEGEPVYLWKGRLAGRMPPHLPHSRAVKRCYHRLLDLLPEGYDIDREQPMALLREPSAPQPDVVVFRGNLEELTGDLMTTAGVVLVAEVADSSLAADRRMANTYAAEGIPFYWLVNLPGRRLEIYSEPAQGVYSRCTTFGPDEEAPFILDGREVGRIRVRDLIP